MGGVAIQGFLFAYFVYFMVKSFPSRHRDP